MIFNIIRKTRLIAAIVATVLIVAACNKDLPQPTPIEYPQPTGQSIAELIAADTSYSFLKAAIARAGLNDLVSDKSKVLTVFAPNNNAFRGLLTALGLPPAEATIGALPIATVNAIVSYHIIGGQALTSTVIPETFPNVQEPTNLVLSAPFFRMSVFPSKRGSALYANIIPVTAPDIAAANGVIHGLPAVLVPPDKTLKQIIAADTSLSFFAVAIARADSGQVGLGRLDSVLNYPPVNFSVFAPVNQALRALLASFGLPPVSGAINFLPVQTVRGLVAYHLVGTRIYSVNVPPTAVPVPTLLQVSPTTPALTIQLQNSGVFTAMGNANGGIPAPIVVANINAVNGALHKLGGVLIPF